MSWVTLPIGPTGVVSVSPVARQQTRDIKNETATAINPSPTETWKPRYRTTTVPMPMGISPATSQELGTSIAASASVWAVRSLRRKMLKARATVRHSSASEVRLEKTITAVPPQSAQRMD